MKNLNFDTETLKLYAITDRAWLKEGETLAEAVEHAILGGVTMVQLREKHLTGEALKELAISVKSVCNAYQVPFIINDDPVLAKEIDADGVHVGQSDMAVLEARALLGEEKIVGATAKTLPQAAKAQAEGADYLGSGAVFGTTTKLDAKPMTKELLNAICDSVEIPVVAIGGIDETNVAGLKDTKISGVAVVSGIFARENVRKAAETLTEFCYGKQVIQCITNSVTMNSVANMVLFLGGSPIMAHHPLEVAEVQSFASGLLLNLGATDDYEAMKIAFAKALELGHPVVIDPVGVGGIAFRREFLKSLLAMRLNQGEFLGGPLCIRGNYGEIRAILEDASTMKGLDYEGSAAEEDVVLELAKTLSCIVVASGAEDLISDGKEVIRVASGSRMQKKITGSGCMLSGAIATKLAARGTSAGARDVAYVCKLIGDAASKAAEETDGAMSFFVRWMDLI